MSRVEHIGNATLYLGDCREIMPTLTGIDAVVTDPPYGIGASSGVGKYGVLKWGNEKDLKWDTKAPHESVFHEIRSIGTQQIIWGMNYFNLPPTRNYLVWDKGAGFKARTFAECELAWCSFDGNAVVYTRDPLARGDYVGKEHPTQKPVEIMVWCLSFIKGQTILDPFMGSGSTGVACIKQGKDFVGIEIEQRYFDIACRRLEKAERQPDMFTPEPVAMTTDDMFERLK